MMPFSWLLNRVKNNNSLAVKSILLLCLLIILHQLTSFSVLMKWDIMDIALPWRYYVSDCINNQILPLWNPFMNSGFPQYGDPSTWYWPAWIIGLLFGYSPLTIQLEFILHLLFAALGMFLLSRTLKQSLVSAFILGLGYSLSGFVVGNAQHFGWIIGAAYLPWLVNYAYKFSRNFRLLDGLILALVLSLMLSGSYPGISITNSYIVLFVLFPGVFGLFKNGQIVGNWMTLLSIAVVSILLCSVTLYSSFELSTLDNRGAGLKFDSGPWAVTTGSLSPQALMTFIIPYSLTSNIPYWGYDMSIINCFFGIIPITLLGAALWQVKKVSSSFLVYLGVGVFFLLVAMAETFPLREWLYITVPFMNLFRFPALFRLYAIFFFLLSSGYALDFILKNPDNQLVFKRVVTMGIIAFSVVQIGIIYKVGIAVYTSLFADGFENFESHATIMQKAGLNVFTHIVILSMLLIAIRLNRFRLMLPILFFIEMFVAVQLNSNYTVWENRPPTDVQQALSDVSHSYHIPDIHVSLRENNDQSNKSIPYLWKNLSIYHKEPSSDGNSPYGLLSSQLAMNANIYDTVSYYPIVFLAQIDGDKITSFRQHKEDITISEFNPNLIKVKVNFKRSANLVLNQNTNPNWIVTIDGKEQKMNTANFTFPYIEVPQGDHEITFTISSNRIMIAFWVSIVSLLLVCTYLILNAKSLVFNK
jgi:hypothetical protein